MKKIIFIILLFSFTVLSFSASELDSLLKDDDEAFKELTTDTPTELEVKEAFVEKIKGEAYVQRGGSSKWLQLIKDATIKEKDTIITMEDSELRIRMEEETFINIGERSKLIFDTMRGRPQEEKMTETGLKLAFGKVFSNVRKRIETGGKYEVEAGSVVAGVRGTQYLTSLQKNGKVNIKVYEGKVFVVPIDVHRKRQQGSDENSSESSSDTSSEEKIVNENEQIDVSEDGVLGEVIQHNDVAPVNEIGSESIEIVEEVEEVSLENALEQVTKQAAASTKVESKTKVNVTIRIR